MKTLHILIVEDEPLVAMDLEMMVTEIVTAAVVVETSVAATKEILQEALDFAFLDVDVTNGLRLHRFSNASVCLLFLCLARRKNSCLRSVPFIPKPFYPAQIERVLQAIVD